MIDDDAHTTVSSAVVVGKNIEKAKELGAAIAKKALEQKISTVVFDRGGSWYHGIIKAVADAAREGGLVF